MALTTEPRRFEVTTVPGRGYQQITVSGQVTLADAARNQVTTRVSETVEWADLPSAHQTAMARALDDVWVQVVKARIETRQRGST